MNTVTLSELQAALESSDFYKHELHFTRVFTHGPLAGTTYEDSIRFVSAIRADEWVRGVNANNARGTVEYRVVPRNLRLGVAFDSFGRVAYDPSTRVYVPSAPETSAEAIRWVPILADEVQELYLAEALIEREGRIES